LPTQHQSDSAQFHEERRSGIGSSDAAAICNADPFKTPLKVFLQKRGELTDDMEKRTEQDRERLYFGTALEDLIADEYSRRTERKVRRQVKAARHKDHEFLIAHLDRRVYPGAHDEEDHGPGVLEIKSPSVWMRDEWDDDAAPLHYQIQMQHHLMVTDLPWGAFAVLIGKDQFLSFDVERNQKFIDKLMAAEVEFWQRVQANDPPQPGPGDADVLSSLYPSDEGASIVLDERFNLLDTEFTRLMKEQREIKKRLDAIKNAIKGEMMSAPFATLENGTGMYKWTKREIKGYTVQPKSYRDFRRVKATKGK
jgi:putative phage-type endonuclease